MGFGGSGSMNIVMKNNRKLLRNANREKFKRTFGKYRFKGKPEFSLPKASPQLLKEIRNRMTFENEQRQRKKTIVFITIIVLLITVMSTVL